MRDLSGDVLKTRSKFAELIIKCLWKIAKRLPTSLQDDLVEPQQLLVDLEHFLQAIPPAEWKRRAADGVPLADLPLRTIKVILTHYANVFGEDALAKLELVSEPENSFVYSYLIRLLNMDDRTERGPARDATAPMAADDDLPDAAEVAGGDHAVGGALGPTSPPLDSEVTDRINGSSSRESQDLDEAANAELRAIFDRISHKDQSRQVSSAGSPFIDSVTDGYHPTAMHRRPFVNCTNTRRSILTKRQAFNVRCKTLAPSSKGTQYVLVSKLDLRH